MSRELPNILLVCTVLVTCGVSLSPVSTVIDWSAVPATVTSRNLNSATLGSCICDLTLNACDTDCCCDPDCLAVEVSSFASCDPETNSAPDVKDCATYNAATELVRINDWGGNIDRVEAAGAAVCLVRNNYPGGAESYFSVPATVTRPADALLLDSEWYTGNNAQTGGFTTGGMVPTVQYQNVSSVSRIISIGSGKLSVPYGSPNGLCHEAYEKPVAFFTPVTSSGCKVSGSGADACSYVDLSRFTQQDALVDPSTSITESSTLIAFTTRVYDASTNQLLYTVDNLPLRSSFFTLSSATDPTDNTTTTPLATTWDATNLQCLNAVVSVRTVITYDMTQTPRARNATRDVYVGTVNTNPITGGSTFRSETYFVRSGATTTPPLTSSREGNPGFVQGKYIPSGVLLEDSAGTGKSAIEERLGGFAIPTGGQDCSLNRYRAVPYLTNIFSSGCYVTITEQELQNVCSNSASGTTALLTSILTLPGTTFPDPASLNTTTTLLTHVARTADALNTDSTSWVPIDGIPFTSPTPSPYNSVTRSCSNLIVGLSYTFVVARAGRESNAQDVIVGAFAEPILGAWQIYNNTDFTSAASTKVPFNFRVSFERYNANSQATLSRRIVAPPILPEIDDTIFYPFRRLQ